MKELPVEFLRECFEYNPNTGDLIWRFDRPRHHFATDRGYNGYLKRNAGKVAGSIDKGHGYRAIGFTINGRFTLFQAHRLVYALFYGWPEEVIDHINGNQTDNRIENLRACSQEENMRNQGTKQSKSTPLKGAYWHNRIQKWQATICVAYKQIHLGYFDTAEEAHAAYCAASAMHHGNYANTGKKAA